MDFSDPEVNKINIMTMSGFLAIYLSAYKYFRVKLPKESPEYACRILTFFHGLVATGACIYYIVLPHFGYLKEGPIPLTLILSHSFGYFAFDLFWCIKYNEAKLMIFHHTLTVVGLIYYSFKVSQQFVIVYSLGITEITNPCLQLRWYLKYHGKREELFFRIVEVVYIALFTIIRLFVVTYYVILMYQLPDMFQTDDLIFVTLGCLVGWGLTFQMYQYIMHMVRKSKKDASKVSKKE